MMEILMVSQINCECLKKSKAMYGTTTKRGRTIIIESVGWVDMLNYCSAEYVSDTYFMGKPKAEGN